MPARKPSGLIERHETAAERADRSAREDALRPQRALPMYPPAELRGKKTASAVWRRLMRTYSDLEAEIVTRMDMGHLVDFCILVEQLEQIDHMRDVAYQLWLELSGEHERLVEEEKADEAVFMAIKVVGAFDAIQKLDTRADRKRDLIKRWRESLYLTPRSKVAAAPKRKEKEQLDDMDLLLDDVTEWVNHGGAE